MLSCTLLGPLGMMQCVDFEAGHATTILRILDLMGLNIVKNSSLRVS